MLTKAYLLQQIERNIGNYPDAALLYKSGDPRILVIIDAMATQLSLFSQQMELAMAEPFEKVRESTVLAAAAMRGIIRKATPAKVKILAENRNLVAATIDTGRVILDVDSNLYVVTAPRIIAAATSLDGVVTPSSAFIEADQYYNQNFIHTATVTDDFYSIELPDPEDGTTLHTLSVTDSNDNPFEYRKNFINALPGNKIFTVEVDDKGVFYIRFGVDGLAGTQVQSGDIFNIYTTRSIGKINLNAGSPFAFDSLTTAETGVDLSKVDLSLNEVLYSGDSPMSISKLRTLCNYPAIYDDSAVFLGEFEFLVRKKYPDMPFLSVWNEALEEAARGGNLDNVNTLFVACFNDIEAVLNQPNELETVHPIEITSLTTRQSHIKDMILAADNSLRVKFYTPVTSKITIVVTAKVSTSHNARVVSAKIKQAILTEFGQSAGNHAGKPLQRLIYALLKEKVPETNAGNAYLTVSVTELESDSRPELWRFVTENSVTVTVTNINVFAQGFD